MPTALSGLRVRCSQLGTQIHGTTTRVLCRVHRICLGAFQACPAAGLLV